MVLRRLLIVSKLASAPLRARRPQEREGQAEGRRGREGGRGEGGGAQVPRDDHPLRGALVGVMHVRRYTVEVLKRRVDLSLLSAHRVVAAAAGPAGYAPSSLLPCRALSCLFAFSSFLQTRGDLGSEICLFLHTHRSVSVRGYIRIEVFYSLYLSFLLFASTFFTLCIYVFYSLYLRFLLFICSVRVSVGAKGTHSLALSVLVVAVANHTIPIRSLMVWGCLSPSHGE